MSKIVLDKLLKRPLMHTHDGMQVNTLLFTDADGVVWEMTVNIDGTLSLSVYTNYLLTEASENLQTEDGTNFII